MREVVQVRSHKHLIVTVYAQPTAGPFSCLLRLQPVLIKHGVLGIGPYMRAYEQQGFRKAWEDPPAGLMPKASCCCALNSCCAYGYFC